MSERFVVIDTATGEILREGWCTTGMAARQARSPGQLGEVPPDGVNGEQHYRDPQSGAYTTRQNMEVALDKSAILADGADMATISGIPDGAEIQAEGQQFENWSRDTFTVSSEQPGEIVVTIRRFPYKETIVRIGVTDGRS